MVLNNLLIDQEGYIDKLNLDGLIKERLLSLGFTKNTSIKKIRNGSKNMIAVYLIRDIMVALRMEEANNILVYINEK